MQTKNRELAFQLIFIQVYFDFTKRKKFDGIQQAYTNSKESSFHVLDHTHKHKVKKESKELSDSMKTSKQIEIQNL